MNPYFTQCQYLDFKYYKFYKWQLILRSSSRFAASKVKVSKSTDCLAAQQVQMNVVSNLSYKRIGATSWLGNVQLGWCCSFRFATSEMWYLVHLVVRFCSLGLVDFSFNESQNRKCNISNCVYVCLSIRPSVCLSLHGWANTCVIHLHGC